ncbi:MAG: sporulation integral membrane protein YtvI [Lachnospiraceae bacterium]|nr:sporulation integral membrane protein YtvI [Lachnospiraceae bacterium]
MSHKSLNSNQRIIIIMGIAAAAVYLGFKYILPLFVPFLLAWAIAWVLRPAVSFLRKRLRIPTAIGGAVMLVLLLAGAGTGLFYLGRMLITQLTELAGNLPEYEELWYEQVQGICAGGDRILKLPSGTVRQVVEENMQLVMETVQDEVVPALSRQSVSVALGMVEGIGTMIIILVAILLIVKDMDTYREKMQQAPFYQSVRQITGRLSEAGAAYLRTQGILMLIIACICTVGLLIIKNKYALVFGIGIAVLDAFPALGSGLILVPWAIIRLLSKDWFEAAVLATTFAACQLVREFLEPRLLGNRIGIPAIGTMMAMYVGVRIFGLFGFFLGPLGLIILVTIYRYLREG